MPYFLTHDQQSLFYRDIGPKNHTPEHTDTHIEEPTTIVLLHGFGMHSGHWLPFALPFAHKLRFIIPDFRGFGRSHLARHNQDCIISNYADDLAQLLRHLKLTKIKLAGISMGAFVGLAFQQNHALKGQFDIEHYLHIDQSPKCLNDEQWHWGLFGEQQHIRLERARRLINIVSTLYANARFDELPEAIQYEMWQQLALFFADAFSGAVYKKLAQQVFRAPRLAKKVMPVENWYAYIHCLRAYIEQDYDMRPVLQRLDTPMTIVVGLDSDMYPCGGQLRIADYHRQCTVKALSGSGHTPLFEQPLKFLQIMKHFAYSS